MVNKQKILIVDDDENIAELISLYLTKECFDTMMVHDGEEALVAFDTYQPNLMLLISCFRALTAYQVCREIRSQDRTHRSLCCLPKVRFLTKYLGWKWALMIIL